MRILPLAAALAVLAMAACAPTTGQNAYNGEYDRLAADCASRGGTLAPSGATTGRPQTENVCNVTSQPSRR